MKKLLIFASLFLIANSLSAQQMVRLKSRTLDGRRPHPPVARLAREGHYILVFHSYPGAEIQQALADRGIRVLQYVPDSALMVTVPAAVELNGLDVAFVANLETADKISPELAARSGNTYLVVFHTDIEAARARQLVRNTAFDVIDQTHVLPNQVVAAGPFARLADLAAKDEVAYIMPASPELVSGVPVIGCAGAVTQAGFIGEYAVAGQKWPQDSSGAVALNYVFQSLTEKMDPNVTRGEIERAFREWTKYTNVTLTAGDRADAARTIAVQFARGEHGDGLPFDGSGKILAHTFYPPPGSVEPFAGDMHLDADEDWHAGYNVDVFSAALHEAGHALGLGHSSDPAAVMYPYFRQSTGLAPDDIAGIQSLYGVPSQLIGPALLPPPLPPTPVPAPTPTEPALLPPSLPPAPAPVPPTAKDITPPALRILNPGATIVSTTSTSIRLLGTASDATGVAAVKWTSSLGASGTAAGLTAWSASVPLLVGTNMITVRAYDAAGNSAWRAVTVVRR